MKIELRGTEEEFEKFVALMDSLIRSSANSEARLTLDRICAEIEDQMEPGAERSMDFVDLKDIFAE